MGNYLSCSLSTTIGVLRLIHQRASGAKVILPDATIRHVTIPATAAELMLEIPGHLLVNARAMRVGHRLSPLSADEDLETGHVYATLPIGRANSVATAADVSLLMGATDKAVRISRVLPAESPEPRLRLCEAGDENMVEFKYRLSLCRSRKPMLETIAEESILSRA